MVLMHTRTHTSTNAPRDAHPLLSGTRNSNAHKYMHSHSYTYTYTYIHNSTKASWDAYPLLSGTGSNTSNPQSRSFRRGSAIVAPAKAEPLKSASDASRRMSVPETDNNVSGSGFLTPAICTPIFYSGDKT